MLMFGSRQLGLWKHAASFAASVPADRQLATTLAAILFNLPSCHCPATNFLLLLQQQAQNRKVNILCLNSLFTLNIYLISGFFVYSLLLFLKRFWSRGALSQWAGYKVVHKLLYCPLFTLFPGKNNIIFYKKMWTILQLSSGRSFSVVAITFCSFQYSQAPLLINRLFVCSFVRLSVCSFVRLSVCPFVRLSLSLSFCLSMTERKNLINQSID